MAKTQTIDNKLTIADIEYYQNIFAKMNEEYLTGARKLRMSIKDQNMLDVIDYHISVITDAKGNVDDSESSDESEISEVSVVEYNTVAIDNVDKRKSNYTNPETNPPNTSEYPSSAEELVCHMHDYGSETFTEDIYKWREGQVAHLASLPQFAQKSVEWLEQRKKCLTATAVATAIDEDPYKYPIELLMDKCGKGPAFIENANVHHGRKYEEIGTMFYMYRNNVIVSEYGLLPDDKYDYLAISPDGICEKTCYHSSENTKLVGRLLEIKFPKTRKINSVGKLDGDICPHYYYVQVQSQLFVTRMAECDFLQCKIGEYDNYYDYIQDDVPGMPGLSKFSGLEKGCLIQLLPRSMISTADPQMCLYNSQYIYPPKLHMTDEEMKEWIGKETMNYHENEFYQEYVIDKVIYWRLEQVACNLVKADTAWFKSKKKILKQFWDYVLFYQNNPDLLVKLCDIVNKSSVEDSEYLFGVIHKDYMNAHPESKYTPLYTAKSDWRKYCDRKYAYLKKYRKNNTY